MSEDRTHDSAPRVDDQSGKATIMEGSPLPPVEGKEQPTLPSKGIASLPPGWATKAAEIPTVDRGHYEVRGEFARGGLGRILRALDRRTGREVAVKEMLGEQAEVAAQRFVREALVTARLQHPAIVPVYEVGRWSDTLDAFYAMKLVSGRSLEEVFNGLQTNEQRLAMVPSILRVAEALAYAHGARIVHRDLKPANVLSGEFGEIVVIDWGLAKHLEDGDEGASNAAVPVGNTMKTIAGAIIGTPRFMPPEQAKGYPVDERADVYAIGAMLYQALSGIAPFDDRGIKSLPLLLATVATETPTPLSKLCPWAPQELLAIVEKAMAEKLEQRYRDAGALAEDLERFANGKLVGAFQYDTRALILRFMRKNRASLTVAASFVGVGLVSGVVAIRSIVSAKRRAEAEMSRAQVQERQAHSAMTEARRSTDRARTELSHALMDKGRLAESNGALARAAMYFAAARTEHDSSEAMWNAGRIEARLIAPTLRYSEHRGAVYTVAVAPSGTVAYTGGDDGHLRVWDSASGSTLHDVNIGHGGVTALAVSPDGSLVAVGRMDGAIELRSNATTDVLRTLEAHRGRVWTLAFSRDGSRLASGAEDSTARVWTLDQSAAPTVLAGHLQRVYGVSFSPDGARLATASDDRSARVWNLANGTSIVAGRENTGGVRDVHFTADGARLLYGTWAYMIGFYNADGSTAPTARWEDRDSVHTVALSPSGTIVASGGDAGTVDLWSERSRSLLVRLEGPQGRVWDTAFSSDGSRLIAVAADGIARVWDTSTMARLHDERVHTRGVDDVQLYDQGRRFATSSSDETVRLWDTIEGTQLLRIDVGVRCADVVVEETIIASCDDNKAHLYALDGTPRGELALGAVSLEGVAVGDGRSVVISGGNIVHLIDMETRRVLRTQRVGEHSIYSVRMGREGLLWTAGLDNHARSWRLPNFELVRDVPIPSEGTISAAESPTGETLIAVGDETLVHRFDLVHNRPLPSLEGHTARINFVRFSPNGSVFVTASTDGTARVWNANGTPRATLSVGSTVNSVDFTPDGARLITAHSNGTLSLWDGNAFTLLRSIGRLPNGERDDCSRMQTSSFSDAAERTIIERACSSEPTEYYARMRARTHLHVQNGISIVEDWGDR